MCSGGQRTVCWNGKIRSLGLRNNDEMGYLCSVRGGLVDHPTYLRVLLVTELVGTNTGEC